MYITDAAVLNDSRPISEISDINFMDEIIGNEDENKDNEDKLQEEEWQAV